jgi:signal transduction histidine kinase
MVSVADKSLFKRWPKALIALDSNDKIVQVNANACAILGWEESDLLGKPLHDSVCSHALGYLHADNACPLVKPDFFTRDSYNEYRWKLKSGDLKAVYAKGMLLHPDNTRLVVFSDQSNTNYSQKDMQRLASFAEHSPTPITEFDAQGNIEFTNPAMIELLSEIGFDENGAPEVVPTEIKELISTMLAKNAPIMGVERVVEGRTFVWDFYPIPASNGILIQAYGREVTAAKLLNESLRREKETAESANKSKSHFLSVMSHELRTPMNSIIGFSRRLLGKADKDLPAQYVGALQTILSSAQNLLTMINETLDMSKIEAGKMTPIISEFSPADLAQEIRALLTIQAEDKHLEFNIHLDQSVPDTIKSDREFLRKIIVNLVGNAIKFTEEGAIDVAIRAANEDTLLIAVKDNGIGISEADQINIFDKFTQASDEASRRYNGSGLGLALCKELTTILGGEIGLESETGVGSLFWVQVPSNGLPATTES